MAETLSTLSIISFAVAGVCLVLAVFFWIFFKIPSVIGDLSGRTARKSIAKMRAANEKTGSKSFKESRTNSERGKLTGTMPGIDKNKKKKTKSDELQPETGLLEENQADVYETQATGVLNEGATDVLEADATTLLIDENATAPLDTTIQKPVKRVGGKSLVMLDEVVLIHTNEVI